MTTQHTATDTCQGCGRGIYFDEDAEIYRLADDPDAIFCGEGVDDHYPADPNEMPAEDDAPPMHCTEFVTGDAAGCARCGEHPKYHDTTKTTTYVAEFPKADMADAFAERVTSDAGYRCTNVVHRAGRRKVTFDGPDSAGFRETIAENIGYFGSPPMGPVATLDGYPTPRSY